MVWAVQNRNLTQGGLNTKEMCAHEVQRWPVLGFSVVSVSETWKTSKDPSFYFAVCSQAYRMLLVAPGAMCFFVSVQ